MKVYCTKRNADVDFGTECVNCPLYESCADRPGAERSIAIAMTIGFWIAALIISAVMI